MIRFSSSQHGSKTVVAIAGRLEEDHLEILEEACNVSPGELVIDASELQHADMVCIRRLQAYAHQGAEIEGASPFIRLLLTREDCTIGRKQE